MSERRGPSTLVSTPSTCTSNRSRVAPPNTVTPKPRIPTSISSTGIREVTAGNGTSVAAASAIPAATAEKRLGVSLMATGLPSRR